VQLVQLGDEQCRWSGDRGLDRLLVGGAEGTDRERAVVDERCLEPERAACDAVSLPLQPCVSAAGAGGDALGDDQVDGYAHIVFADACRGEPDAGLRAELEVGGPHRRFERGGLGELGGVEREVAVGRVRGDRQVCVAGAQVDRLGAGDDHRQAVRLQRRQRVEQHASRRDIQRVDRSR
jgi:hypothetical protein